MRILIADDEAPARARLASLLAELGTPWQVVAQASDGDTVIACCARGEVDVVLLDIRMPGTHGLAAAQYLATLPRPPAVIFTTAYDQHALAAFEADAIDYLLKPIRKERLLRALQKAQASMLAATAADDDDAITVTLRGGLQRIPLGLVYFLQADSKYVRVRHEGGEALTEDSLVSLEERFPDRFLRIHRGVLVAQTRLVGLVKDTDGMAVQLAGVEDRLPVSRRHLPTVRQWLKGAG